jgi:O-acetyl-ADP-ribose deacetylase (regulator of RNase III)
VREKRRRLELIEKHGDLFAQTDGGAKRVCLAHCISEDCRMGAGIALQFANRFGGHEYRRRVKACAKSVGQVAVVASSDAAKRHLLFNLITKKHFYEKPRLAVFVQTLVALRALALENDVTKLYMPRIGCGLDRLQWSDVREAIDNTFGHSGIQIVVCVPANAQ